MHQPRVSLAHSLSKPVAIAMWDYSWLLRHHLGEFADFDRVLDALVDRGYNAVRIEAFPHFVAADRTGQVIEEFYIARRGWSCPTWGMAFSGPIRPRAALIEFLMKCRARGVRVSLSSWFQDHGAHARSRVFEGIDGFVRAWDETLAFIDEHGLLQDILYVDLLNEYPLWHEFTWFKDQMKAMADPATSASSGGPVLEAHMWNVGAPHNTAQRAFSNAFIGQVITRLSARWPALHFHASFSYNENVPWHHCDLSGFAALDVHVWAVHHPGCFAETGYLNDMHPLQNDAGFARCQEAVHAWWRRERRTVTAWLDQQLAFVAETGRRHGLALGNTEGWGPINWTEHPALDWSFTKDAGEVGVELALKHGYKFICTSNFTHPQFISLWDDLDWHRRLTAVIRS